MPIICYSLALERKGDCRGGRFTIIANKDKEPVSLFRNRVFLTLVVLAGLGVGAIASWAIMHTAFHATADYEFCTSCHSYEPIAKAYREDIHGGNNSVGFRAACNDCHLPHDNALHYFFVKAKHQVLPPTLALPERSRREEKDQRDAPEPC